MKLVELLAMHLLPHRQSPFVKAWADYFSDRNAIARTSKISRAWVVCPSCGEQGWVLPPHGLDPCPLVIQAAQDLGLKFDAERSASIRAGLSMEDIARSLRGNDAD